MASSGTSALTSGSVESTWESRDLPVLDAIVRWFEEHPPGAACAVRDIAEASGFDAMTVWKACRAMDGVYVDLRQVMAGGNPEPHHIQAVSAEARRLVGQWPSAVDYLDRLLVALEERAADMDDPEQRSKLRKAAEYLGGMSREVAVGVATAALGGAVS